MNQELKDYAFCSLLLIGILILPACWSNKKDDQLVALANSSIKVISVNDKSIYDDAHIKGDINIEYDKLDELDKVAADWDKNSPIVIYCTNYSCTASKIFAKEFIKLGFKNVSVYSGGMADWYHHSLTDKSYPVVGPMKEAYLKEELIKPENQETDIKIITAQELHDQMKKAELI